MLEEHTTALTEESAELGFRLVSLNQHSELSIDDGDGDQLHDSYESNTGIFVSATDTGTDPNSKDTDQDGLRDGYEVNIIGTNPNLADTDRDGLKDGAEVLVYLTDPQRMDSDNDDLNDRVEVAAAAFGFDPLVNSSEVYEQFKAIVVEMPGMLTNEQRKGLPLGGTKLTPINATSMQLDFVIETSPNMSDWEEIRTVSETINITGSKSFVRVRAESN